MFKLSSNWRRRFHNRPAQKSCGCFTAYIYLWKKTHSTNNICKQRRSPKNREALNIWILICEITCQWHAASVTPCTHEINKYKQNCLPLETSSAKFSATTNFLFSLSSLHTLNKGIFHDIKTTTTEKPTWNRQEQWPVNAVHVLNQRIVKSFCFRPLTDVLTRKSNAPPGGPHFGSNSPLLTRVKCPGIAGGGGDGRFWNWLVHNQINNMLLLLNFDHWHYWITPIETIVNGKCKFFCQSNVSYYL